MKNSIFVFLVFISSIGYSQVSTTFFNNNKEFVSVDKIPNSLRWEIIDGLGDAKTMVNCLQYSPKGKLISKHSYILVDISHDENFITCNVSLEDGTGLRIVFCKKTEETPKPLVMYEFSDGYCILDGALEY